MKTFYCDDGRTSCYEIAKELIDTAGAEITRDMGLILLGGIPTDNGYFKFAKPSMLPMFSDMMVRRGSTWTRRHGSHPDPGQHGREDRHDEGRRMLQFERVGEMIDAISFGGSFETSSCRAIIAAGAYVAFMGSRGTSASTLAGGAPRKL